MWGGWGGGQRAEGVAGEGGGGLQHSGWTMICEEGPGLWWLIFYGNEGFCFDGSEQTISCGGHQILKVVHYLNKEVNNSRSHLH